VGKATNYKLRLRLSDDVDRDTYFLGRYYDLEIQLLLDALLEPGDTFLDIGANVGRTTLHAASRVGPTGRVISVEPQPECCLRIREAIEDNGLTFIDVHNLAAGDDEETLRLKILGGGSIMAALAIDPIVDGPNVRDEVATKVIRCDRLVPEAISGKLVVKIDIEGFELYCLRGLVQAIDRHSPSILTEVEPRYLERAGVDVEQLFDFFRVRKYSSYVIGLATNWLRRPSLSLRKIASPSELRGDIDVLWIPDGLGAFDPTPWFAQRQSNTD